MRRNFAIALLMMLCVPLLSQVVTVKGIVFDRDSTTPMSFAYVANKNSTTGTLTDEGGKFSIHIKLGDTLSFSYMGYGVTKIFTQTLKDSVKNNLLNVKVYLKQKASELRPVVIENRSFTKEEKEYYSNKVDEYNRGISSPMASPISAMYYAWSKRGHQLQKLSVLYQQLLIDEVKEHRLSDQKLRMITGNDTLNTEAFRRYCYLSDQWVISASDYNLFYSVKQYYKQYEEIQRRKKQN